MTTNIDEVVKTMRQTDQASVTASNRYASSRQHAQALADAGLLAADLPEPTYGVARGIPTWVGADGDEIKLYKDGTIGVASRDRNLEQARDLAYRLIAAANYAERNHQ